MSWQEEWSPFQRKVYEVVRKIPKGQVRTYAWVAKAIGKSRAGRAVGQALKRNRWAPKIPCHRVVASNGRLGGYSAKGGLHAKRRLLLHEGVRLIYDLRTATGRGVRGRLSRRQRLKLPRDAGRRTVIY